MKHAIQTLTSCGFAFLLVGCATRSEFDRLYDHYYPKRTEYVQGDYRRAYDRYVFGSHPPKLNSTRIAYLYHAIRNDPAAVHAFLNHPDRDVDGEPGESWDNDCVLLLIRLGDERFSELLAREDLQTRKFVSYSLDPKIDWRIHHFPKTRALYSYRYIRRQP